VKLKLIALYVVGVVLLVSISVTLALIMSSTARRAALGAEAATSNVLTQDPPLIARGRRIFRYDTFGDQGFWGGTIHLNKAIEGAKLGGVGAGVSPKTALAVGLKVDAAALPPSVAAGIKAGKVDLNSPATTLALLKLNAVVGVRGFFNAAGGLQSMGVTCALCHSTVDNSFAPGIGRRLDGWANRDLNVGAIVSLAPNLTPVARALHTNVPTVLKVLRSWGPGKFDAELNLDGKAFRPDGRSAATLIPPAFGLAGVNLHTWTGWGQVTYWNAFVANLEMHGQGNFFDPRLDNARQFPLAASERLGHIHHRVDLITPKLGALHAYQLSLAPPRPPKGSFNPAAAARGRILFDGQARCSSCHVPPLFTEPGWNLHKPSDIGIDAFQANRSPTHAYRTAPLRGLFSHSKGGFYHDGRFASLMAVVNHYNSFLKLGLTNRQKWDLVQYLKSL
jgi:mono/diheme cytochrome c family protein